MPCLGVVAAVHDVYEHVHLGGQLCAVPLKVLVGQVNGVLRLAPHLFHEALILILDAFHLHCTTAIVSAFLVEARHADKPHLRCKAASCKAS